MWNLLVGLFGAAAVGLLASACIDALSIQRLLAEGVAANGTVIAVQASNGPPHGGFKGEEAAVATYAAVVSFTDDSGATHVARAVPSLRSVMPGEHVTVWYRRSEPDAAIAFVDSPWSRPCVFFGGAIIAAAFAYAAYGLRQLSRNRAAVAHPQTG
jgi:Protein of unknown function (DUF3592)